MKTIAFLLVAVLLSGCDVSFNSTKAKPAPAETGTAAQQQVVVAAANTFLKGLDTGAVDETWPGASPHLHKISNRLVWSASIRTFRSSVGAFHGRKLLGVGFHHTVDGFPDGEYAAVGFDTRFGESTVEEKVVLHKDRGEWKVMGYFMKKTLSAQF